MLVEWCSVKNYEGLYEVSNMGQVRSIDRDVFDPVHQCYSHRKGKELTLTDNGNGYLKVNLWKDSKGKNFYVHRLVYEAFAGEIPEDMTINHIDHDTYNNNIDNLELMTLSQNSSNIRTKKKVQQLTLQGELVAEYDSIVEAKKALGMKSNSTGICKCCRGAGKSCAGFKWQYKEA